jgi:twinkle protein
MIEELRGFATTADGREPKMTMHEKHREWIEARGIDPLLADKFGLTSVVRDGKRWLSVPYPEAGTVINHKYRLTTEKDHRMDPGAPLLLWNADCLTDPKVQSGLAPLVITEGEWDALAAIQSGFQYAVSVPNGAPGKPTDDLETAKRYEWVDRHADALAKVKTFVLAADADPAGYNLASDLAALLGADRCKFIDYPFPCKDLNEVLTEYGPQRVVDLISTAKPYPIKGLYRASDFPPRGEVRSYSCGIPALCEHISIVPGTLTVLTGYANSGKSTLMNQIIGHALRYHFPVCVASFETDVKPILLDGLRTAIMKCSRHDLTKTDTSDADDIIESRLSIITQAVDEDAEMDLDSFLEYCRIAVVRDGCKMIVLDPWNEIEHKRRRDESETEYIGRALRQIKRFIRQYDVAFWLVAHPSKPQSGFKGIPGLYDISGSAHWANKADYGLTYHRPDPTVNFANVLVSKVRMGLPGARDKVGVSFDFLRSEFVRAA